MPDDIHIDVVNLVGMKPGQTAVSPLNWLQKPLCAFRQQSRSYVYSLETLGERDRGRKKELVWRWRKLKWRN